MLKKILKNLAHKLNCGYELNSIDNKNISHTIKEIGKALLKRQPTSLAEGGSESFYLGSYEEGWNDYDTAIRKKFGIKE